MNKFSVNEFAFMFSREIKGNQQLKAFRMCQTRFPSVQMCYPLLRPPPPASCSSVVVVCLRWRWKMILINYSKHQQIIFIINSLLLCCSVFGWKGALCDQRWIPAFYYFHFRIVCIITCVSCGSEHTNTFHRPNEIVSHSTKWMWESPIRKHSARFSFLLND